MTYRFEIAFGSEIPLAGRAIVMKVRLTIVLLQTIIVDEDLVTRSTIIVDVFVVVLQFAEVVKMLIAILAIRVARALNPMFLQPGPRCKVLGAVLTYIVTQ